MSDVLKKLEILLTSGEHVLNPRRWLAEEVSELALRIPRLDEAPSQAVLLLAKLVTGGQATGRTLALAIDIDEAEAHQWLESLCESKFVVDTANGYEATPAGREAFEEVGKQMVKRELFEHARRQEQLRPLREWLYPS